MLRAPEPGPREAGAATQGKPLTSFLIQDILRDGVERRGSHAGSLQPPLAPQPTRPPAPRRHPEPEPEGGRGGAGAQEDAPSARPRAAPGKAVPPGETDAGKRARPGLGRVGTRRERTGRASGLRARAHGRPRRRGAEPAAPGAGTSLPPAVGVDIRLTRLPGAPGSKASAHAARTVSPPPPPPHTPQSQVVPRPQRPATARKLDQRQPHVTSWQLQ